MTKEKDFDQYIVYEQLGGKTHQICVCQELDVAFAIATLLAKQDPKYDAYHVTSISNGGFIAGGGWRASFKRNKEDEKVYRIMLM